MNKSVVITGVSSGFGLAAAKMLLARGYRVYGSVRKPQDADKAGEFLQAPEFTPLLFDVTNHEAVGEAATGLAKELGDGGIAGLVNNAGVAPLGPLEHISIPELRNVFEINVFGVLAVSQAFLPLLKRGPDGTGSPAGRIINISSTNGIVTFPMVGAYSASKHALESLNDGLRRELLRYGIPVIAIEPGSIRTPIWDKAARQSETDKFAGTAYAELMAQLPDFFEQRLQSARPISAVTDAIVRALEARKPRTRYPLDTLWYAGKHLGDRLLDRIIRNEMPKG